MTLMFATKAEEGNHVIHIRI
jgi:hypothetical protein